MRGNTESQNLGALVKSLRISQGLTQEEVAKALDVTPGYISNVENGRNLMTLRMLIYYADLTNVSVDYLARGAVQGGYDESKGLKAEIIKTFDRLSPDMQRFIVDMAHKACSYDAFKIKETTKKEKK